MKPSSHWTDGLLPPGRGQRDRQHIGDRLRAHGGEIGQIDAQHLGADAVRRIFCQKWISATSISAVTTKFRPEGMARVAASSVRPKPPEASAASGAK